MSEAGRRVGGYRLIQRLGAGGAAEVWEAEAASGAVGVGAQSPPAAHARGAAPRVALKIVRVSAGGGGTGGGAGGGGGGAGGSGGAGAASAGGGGTATPRRFAAEAAILASLRHPNIVEVIEVGVDSERGEAFLAMELLRGQTLAGAVEGRGALPLGLVVALARDLAAALDYAHRAVGADGRPLGLVHRDIKPSNLFVTTGGTLKLIDFGIALARDLDRTATRTGAIRGSFPYLAPEQARGEPLDARSDLFSAGLVLHELLTGRRVFGQENEIAILNAVVSAPIPAVRLLRPDVPAALDRLVGRMLARERAARLSSAAELAAELETALPAAEVWSRADVGRWVERQAQSRGGEGAATKTAEGVAIAGTAPPIIARQGDRDGGGGGQAPALQASTGGVAAPRGGAQAPTFPREGLNRESQRREEVPSHGTRKPSVPQRLRVSSFAGIVLAGVVVAAIAWGVWASRGRGRGAGRAAADAQPSFPVRAAFYYMPHIDAEAPRVYPPSQFHPTLAEQALPFAALVERHVAAMLHGHIDVGISSWRGVGARSDEVVPALLEAAQRTPFRWTLYHEAEGREDPDPGRIRADLAHIAERYARHPAFFRVGDRFVLFVYSDGKDGCAMVKRWKQANTLNAYLVLRAFEGHEACAEQPDAWHSYFEKRLEQTGSWSATICPGVWHLGAEVELGRDLARWRQDVRWLVATRARFQIIISFNEWSSGTSIESAREWTSPSGFGAYADVLHDEIPARGTPGTAAAAQSGAAR